MKEKDWAIFKFEELGFLSTSTARMLEENALIDAKRLNNVPHTCSDLMWCEPSSDGFLLMIEERVFIQPGLSLSFLRISKFLCSMMITEQEVEVARVGPLSGKGLSYTIDSDLSSSIWDLDPSLIIDESRPKVENELNFICNNMTNHTIKEAISQHLIGFKAGHLPKKRLPRVKFADLTLLSLPKTFILELIMDKKRVSSQSEMKTTNKKSKLGSGDGEFWSDADFDLGYHDHNKRIKKKEDIFSQINAIFGDLEPGPLGKGIEIQHASTADYISEDDIWVDWDPECLENGVGVPNDYTVDDSLEDDYDMNVQHDFTVDDSSEHIDNLAKMSNSSMKITSLDPTKVGSAKTKHIPYTKLSCWCLSKGMSAKWRASNEYVWMLGLNRVPAYVVFLELPLASYRGDDETRWLVNGEQLISPVTKVIGLVECLIHFLIYAVPRGCLGLLDFSLYDDARNFKK
ncbi:hypothetical protein Tco_0253129 [Tanacetum coccineum]